MNSLEIDVAEFRRLAGRVTELAADYLASLPTRPAFPDVSADDVGRLFSTSAPETGEGPGALDSLPLIADCSRPTGPRFFAYVLGSGEPVAAIADLFASVLNQSVTAWRSGPAAVTIERTVVGWLAQAIGCRGFSGSLTGGGSPANLMGLAMARESRLPANEAGARPGTIYASHEAHMSIGKAVALLGLGRENLRLIPTDDQFRMSADALERAIRRDRDEGKTPIAIVASAGTVNTGAIDPLRDIAAIARRYDTWLHVDGAYGALAAVAVPEKFGGLELADSLSLDAHKWLYQPLDCGCLLYRDPAAARAAFSHTGDYARSLSADPVEGFAFFEESLELSRRFRALKLWLSLRYHGWDAFRQAIHGNLEQAQRLARIIQEHSALELLAPVELSAVCFRYREGEAGDCDRRNAAILREVIRRGRVYISNATIGGHFALRACIVNHRTTDSDVNAVVEEVLAAGAAQ
jgi:aromatic-L-amino-acid/L-tryptophan decarboxylase